MKVLEFLTCGDPSQVIALNHHAPRDLQTGEVRVKILAAPVNPADLNFIQGNYGAQPQLPSVAGMEGCGEVIESRSPQFSPGQRVLFLERGQTWAQQAIAADHALLAISPEIPITQAAMLKVNPATAWQLLTQFSTLAPGSWIVQNAANSGVGRCVIAIAKILGLHTCNFVRGTERLDELRALGADAVFLDEDASLDAARAVLPAQGAARACNAVGGESALRLAKLLAPNASHITYGAMARRPLTIPNSLLIFQNLTFRGLWITQWIANAPRREVENLYHTLGEHLSSGAIAQAIDATFSLNDFPAALARAQQANRNGKVLFTP